MRVVCESECVVEPLGRARDGTAVLSYVLVKRLQSRSVLLLHVKSVARGSLWGPIYLDSCCEKTPKP
eukprot:6942367-Prymnesium_polylepis.1